MKAYEAANTMAEIAEVITQNEKRMIQAVQAITVAKASMDNIAATYGPFIAELNATAIANPGNVTWEELKTRKDLYVMEFSILKAYATDLETAATGVAKP